MWHRRCGTKSFLRGERLGSWRTPGTTRGAPWRTPRSDVHSAGLPRHITAAFGLYIALVDKRPLPQRRVSRDDNWTLAQSVATSIATSITTNIATSIRWSYGGSESEGWRGNGAPWRTLQIC